MGVYFCARTCDLLSIFWNNKNTNIPGNSIAEVCRKYSISRSIFDKWRQKFKGMSSNEAKRLKVLEEEKKEFLLKKELEIQVLRDIVKKNF